MKNDGVGKGNVTPTQVAFIVDRYLRDNNFSRTRTVFRNEAASLISRTPVDEGPKSLLSLGEILEDYISLKGQKVMLDQETARVEQENLRISNLLHGMQEVMNVYNGSSSAPSVAPTMQASATKQVAVISRAPAGGAMYKPPSLVPVPRTANSKLSAPVTNPPLTRKRAGSNPNGVVQQQAPRALKKFKLLSKPTTPTPAAQGSNNCLTRPQATNESSSANSLFNQPQSSSSPRIECSSPETPPQQSISSPNDKSGSMVGISPHGANCSVGSIVDPQDATPTGCTVITSERVTVSPCKHVSYTVERNRFVSSPSPMKTGSKMSVTRDCVKARLDFGGSDETVCVDNHNLRVDDVSTPGSDQYDDDIFGMNLPAMFGPDFSFAELLDLGLEGPACPCEPTSNEQESS